MLSPLLATLSNLPRRSTSMTVACGTILIVLTAITSNTIAMNPKNRNAKAEATGSIRDPFHRFHGLYRDYVSHVLNSRRLTHYLSLRPRVSRLGDRARPAQAGGFKKTAGLRPSTRKWRPCARRSINQPSESYRS